ncbi:MAG: hypothetical protein OK455_06790 [Thaumarchaeota archaeon]|nr:hypothetical protein [Nitrososphaerota archaeon]
MGSPRHRDKKQSRSDKSSASPAEQSASELKTHEAMLEALVEVLEEKGIIEYSDWVARAKRKLVEQEEAVEDRGP